jgi:hypothetical protein
MSTIKELTHDLNSSNVFSRIDLNKAFHQLELDETSRDITVFIAHRGILRYKRLNMGTSCAKEIFQHVIQTRVLVGLKGEKI